MEYRGISIEVYRERLFAKVPVESATLKTKELLTTETKVKMCILGNELHDFSFLFELRSILEEFISKKLGKYSNDEILNTNQDALGEYCVIKVTRSESLLVIAVEDFFDKCTRYLQYNMIHAKTLHSILSKAIQVTSI